MHPAAEVTFVATEGGLSSLLRIGIVGARAIEEIEVVRLSVIAVEGLLECTHGLQ